MITVTVQYFAALREQAGRSLETVRTSATSAAALFDELRGRHGFTLPAGAVKVAVNDEFATWGDALRDGDRVVFLPPMAGG